MPPPFPAPPPPADDWQGAAVPPTFARDLRPLRVRDGDPVTFECVAAGNPPPNVTWFRESVAIHASADFAQRRDPATGRCSLAIREVYPEDTGTYTAVLRSAFGTATSEATLVVEEGEERRGATLTIRMLPARPCVCVCVRVVVSRGRAHLVRSCPAALDETDEPVAPSVVSEPQPQVADEGESVRFECRLAANPTPQVRAGLAADYIESSADAMWC